MYGLQKGQMEASMVSYHHTAFALLEVRLGLVCLVSSAEYKYGLAVGSSSCHMWVLTPSCCSVPRISSFLLPFALQLLGICR